MARRWHCQWRFSGHVIRAAPYLGASHLIWKCLRHSLPRPECGHVVVLRFLDSLFGDLEWALSIPCFHVIVGYNHTSPPLVPVKTARPSLIHRAAYMRTVLVCMCLGLSEGRVKGVIYYLASCQRRFDIVLMRRNHRWSPRTHTGLKKKYSFRFRCPSPYSFVLRTPFLGVRSFNKTLRSSWNVRNAYVIFFCMEGLCKSLRNSWPLFLFIYFFSWMFENSIKSVFLLFFFRVCFICKITGGLIWNKPLF